MRRDLDYTDSLPGRPRPVLLPSDMLPCTPLGPKTGIVPELVISGTYDWIPKGPDLLAFARLSRGLATCRSAPMRFRPKRRACCDPPSLPIDTTLRLGLITNCFEADYKLKTLAYIAASQLVLSFRSSDPPGPDKLCRPRSPPWVLRLPFGGLEAVAL